MVQASVIRVAGASTCAATTGVFSSLAHQRLRRLSPLDAAHLAEDIRAEYLHLASLRGDAHVRVRLAAAIG